MFAKPSAKQTLGSLTCHSQLSHLLWFPTATPAELCQAKPSASLSPRYLEFVLTPRLYQLLSGLLCSVYNAEQHLLRGIPSHAHRRRSPWTCTASFLVRFLTRLRRPQARTCSEAQTGRGERVLEDPLCGHMTLGPATRVHPMKRQQSSRRAGVCRQAAGCALPPTVHSPRGPGKLPALDGPGPFHVDLCLQWPVFPVSRSAQARG